MRRPATTDVADRVVSPASLLHTTRADALILPTIPVDLAQADAGHASVEFAAASVLDRVTLAALVRAHQPRRLFEIGTFRGVTALTMAANAPVGGVLYTLDLPPSLTAAEIATTQYADNAASGFHRLAATGTARDVGRVLATHTGGCRIEQLFGDSSKVDFTPFHGAIDFFFVDGCHTYGMALADTRTALACLRRGGVLVWHDYPWRDVQLAIRDARVGVPVTAVRGTNIAYATVR